MGASTKVLSHRSPSLRSLLEVFCDVDDFCQQFEPVWRQHLVARGRLQRQRARRLNLSEVMTILIVFHHSHYRTFKAFYPTHVLRHWRTEFPGLVSYELRSLWGVHSLDPRATVCVSPPVLWLLYGDLLCGCDGTGGVP